MSSTSESCGAWDLMPHDIQKCIVDMLSARDRFPLAMTNKVNVRDWRAHAHAAAFLEKHGRKAFFVAAIEEERDDSVLIEIACSPLYDDMFSFEEGEEYDVHPVMAAVYIDRPDLLREFIERRFHPVSDNMAQRALMTTICGLPQPECTQVILSCHMGVDVNQPSFSEYFGTILPPLNAAANTNIFTEPHSNIFHELYRNVKLDVVRILMAHRAKFHNDYAVSDPGRPFPESRDLVEQVCWMMDAMDENVR